MQKKAEECLGSSMIFELTDYIKSELTEINDGVVNALQLAEDKGRVENALKVGEVTSGQRLTYTPVTEVTFAKWCDAYKERLRLEKSLRLTELETKPTGKQMFLMSKAGLDDLTIDEDEETSEVLLDEQEESKCEDEEEEEEAFKYDRALYDADGLEEDVDFDD